MYVKDLQDSTRALAAWFKSQGMDARESMSTMLCFMAFLIDTQRQEDRTVRNGIDTVTKCLEKFLESRL